MLTIFTVPKPFKGHINTIQRNSIKSWKLIKPKPEIILFGNDAGIKEAAQEFSVTHVPDIKCNDYGTPLLSDVFAKAKKMAKTEILCYVNADILLFNDIIDSINKVKFKKFLIVGQRWNLDITNEIDFTKQIGKKT